MYKALLKIVLRCLNVFLICELIIYNAKNEIVRLNKPYGWKSNYQI